MLSVVNYADQGEPIQDQGDGIFWPANLIEGQANRASGRRGFLAQHREEVGDPRIAALLHE
jgi:hypothetical protein